jgi:signal recognition particle GTPase
MKNKNLINKFKLKFLNIKKKIFGSKKEKEYHNKNLFEKKIQKLERNFLELFFSKKLVKNIKLKLIKNIKSNSFSERIFKKFLLKYFLRKLKHSEFSFFNYSSLKKINIFKKKLNIIILIGKSGSGKTITSAKIAFLLKKIGYKVLIGSINDYDQFFNKTKNETKFWSKELKVQWVLKKRRSKNPFNFLKTFLLDSFRKKFNFIIFDNLFESNISTNEKKKNFRKKFFKLKKIVKKMDNFICLNTFLVIDGIFPNSYERIQELNSIININSIIYTKMDIKYSQFGKIFEIYKNSKIPTSFIGIGEKKENLKFYLKNEYIKKILTIIT